MKYYELSYILSPSLKEEEVVTIEEELKTLLANAGAQMESWDNPKRQFLAYEINDSKEAVFGAYRFNVAKDKIEALQKSLRGNSKIIRFMLLEWKKFEARVRLPKPPMRQAEEQVPTDEKALDEKLEEIFQKGAEEEAKA